MAKKKPAKSRKRRRSKSASKAQKSSAAERTRSIVGDLVNFRGLVYAPINESGVVFLFGKVAADLNMYVEEIKTGFPDCIARRFTGKGWEKVAVEFEFRSSHFRQHKHDPKGCDMIVCWEHDWPTCPLEVIELRERIKELENEEISRPGEVPTGPQGDAGEWAKNNSVSARTLALFDKLWDHIRNTDESAFYKVGARTISFFSPQRTFVRLFPRKTKLRMNIFTNGKKLGGVTQCEFERGAEKWGMLSVGSENELKAALPWVTESLKRIKKAIRDNEPTGWYATTESGEEE